MDQNKINFVKAGRASRKPISLTGERVVKVEEPLSGGTPLTIRPGVGEIDLVDWVSVSTNRDLIEKHLLVQGSVLLRDFLVGSVDAFETFVKTLCGDPLKYTYGSTPRSQVSGNIYTSTEYPADQSIPMHNELSYTTAWPLRICFFCMQPADQGGETPIADSRKVFARIPPDLRERFAQQGVMYVRNYAEGVDLSWQEVFQTEDAADVERYCRSHGIEFAWKGKNHLRTWQVCQAVATHPKTGEEVWFNQAHLFHISSLDPTVQRELLTQFQEDDLPRNAYYGDGTRIEETTLAVIRDAYQQEMCAFPWQKGDIMLLDNMLAAHGRMPFVGKRKVVVGMSELFSS